MALEDLYRENKEKKDKKNEEEEKYAFLEEQAVLRESSELLNTLAQEISEKFWIDIAQVKEFIKDDTLGNLDNLKHTLNTKVNVQELQKAILSARSSIEDISKQHREALKKSLIHEEYLFNDEYIVSKKLFKKYIPKVENPETFWDHTLGIALGILDSTEAVILFVYGLSKWIIFTPYHLYLLISKKASYVWKNQV